MIDKERMAQLIELVKTFEQKIDEVKNQAYNEDNLRVDFVDKFFEYVLGWDVRNKNNDSEDFREVYREDKVYVKGKPKAPDYSFRIGGKRIFFLETKKPSVSLEKNPEPALQIRWYGHSARVGMSILTNFEHFIIYDTRIAPKSKDKFDTAVLFSCSYKEYEKNFEFLYNTISNEAVRQGKLKNWLGKDPKGSLSVDKGILNLIEDWRTSLAKNIAVKNTELDIFSLNRSVQKIIDRIIFLRIAEDRGIEDYCNLSDIADNPAIFKHLTEYFEKANKKYNSGLFSTDAVLNGLKIDNEVLEHIIKNLYFPKCPYEFSFLPIEILGNIYEQFLGKTIHLTDGHHAKVEEKPEVRKAGGVYYTPQYIVDYIVKNTVGEKIKDKTPKDIEGLKILDPACGSGSFLIGAYTFLLSHHLNCYTRPANLQKALKEERIYKTGEDHHLSIKEKQKILLNNIYGVDIDSQAVEVSRLSLLLKLMEGENQESVGYFFKHSDLKPLPDLSNNIKCGNSLISGNTLELQSCFGDDYYKVNAFNWEERFSQVMRDGGFDVVIGNPPYVRIQSLNDSSPAQVRYYNEKFSDCVSGSYDLYLLFINRGLSLLNKTGVLGYIVPHKFFQAEMGQYTREAIQSKKALYKIVDFTTNQVFENATTYTCLLFLTKAANETVKYKRFDLNSDFHNINDIMFDNIDAKSLDVKSWNFSSRSIKSILDKICSQQNRFSLITEKIFKGSSTGNDDVFLFDPVSENKDTSLVLSEQLQANIKIEKDLLVPFLYGEDIRRYGKPLSKKRLLFPYKLQDGNLELIPANTLKNNYPLAYDYLLTNKDKLMARKVALNNENFYKYSAARSLNDYNKPKIMIPDMLVSNRISFDPNGAYFHGPAIHSVVFNEQVKDYNYQFFLAILNSKVFWFFIANTSTALRGNAYRLTPEYLEPFCFPKIESQNIDLKKTHDHISNLVDCILGLNEKLSDVKSSEQYLLRQQISQTDSEIDELVYKLYGLTKEEIKMVEDDRKI